MNGETQPSQPNSGTVDQGECEVGGRERSGQAQGGRREPGGGLRVGSLFSGIGGFDLGLERAGHRVVFQCESDPYRRRVLARHWLGVPCFEDVADVGASAVAPAGRSDRRGALCTEENGERGSRIDGNGLHEIAAVDLLCGGFPCQDLSVAGKRAGLDGERSGLFFEFARIADDLLGSGGWLLIENVPGLLSSNGGRDFAVLLATLAELGFHDLAWRVLDSRYLGVPQRRRRVFILARRARGRRASKVLLEPESGGGDFEAGGAPREGVAGSVADGADSARSLTASERWDGETEDFIARTLKTDGGHWKGADHDTYISTPIVPDRDRTPSGVPGRVDIYPTISSQEGGTLTQIPPVLAPDGSGDRCALDPKPDGPRYAACGDAVTVQVAEWIGRRLP